MAELYLKTQWTFHGFSLRVNSACFVQVNRLLLSKTYKKPSGELIFGRGETTFSWEKMTLSWGQTTLSWGKTTLSWGETTWGETDLGRSDRNSLVLSSNVFHNRLTLAQKVRRPEKKQKRGINKLLFVDALVLCLCLSLT